MLWLTSGAPESAPGNDPAPRLVFLMTPGPGGGGGGGGLRNPLPPRKAESPARLRTPRPAVDASPVKSPLKARPIEVRQPKPPVPAPTPVEQDPVPSRRLVAPVAPTTNAAQRDGAVQARAESTSQGSGVDGGTGTGRGTGDGEGLDPELDRAREAVPAAAPIAPEVASRLRACFAKSRRGTRTKLAAAAQPGT